MSNIRTFWNVMGGSLKVKYFFRLTVSPTSSPTLLFYLPQTMCPLCFPLCRPLFHGQCWESKCRPNMDDVTWEPFDLELGIFTAVGLLWVNFHFSFQYAQDVRRFFQPSDAPRYTGPINLPERPGLNILSMECHRAVEDVVHTRRSKMVSMDSCCKVGCMRRGEHFMEVTLRFTHFPNFLQAELVCGNVNLQCA